MLGFIQRSCNTFSNIDSLRSLNIANVRSLLEYASVVWSPWQKQQQNSIERVQIKFIKFICFKTKHPYDRGNYEVLCQYFNLSPLHRRRQFSDAIFLYKCVNNMYDCPDIFSWVNFNVLLRITRNHSDFRTLRQDIVKMK